MSAEQRALTERIAAIDQQAMAEGRIVGSVVLVAWQGEICYAGAAGYADREARRPMRRETQFRLSSVSKPYTTLAALRLIEQGKLSLDDAVSEWLPWFTPALADGRRPTIKIRHLLSHTAGLDYRLNQPPAGVYHQLGIQDGVELSTLTLEQNLRLLAQAPLLSAPGERFNYSLAIDVLGAVLERVTGMPLPQLFVEWVAQPLRLGNTAFHATDAANLATPYYNTPQGPQRMHEGLRVALPEEMAGGRSAVFTDAGAQRRGLSFRRRGHGRRCRRRAEAGGGITQRRAGYFAAGHSGVAAQPARGRAGANARAGLGIRFWRGAAGGRRSGTDAAACRHADLGRGLRPQLVL